MANGKLPVKIYIGHKGKNSFIPTDIYVKENQWHPGDTETDPSVKKNCTGYKALNSILTNKLEQVHEELLKLSREGTLSSFTNVTVLKNHLSDKLSGKTSDMTFTDFYEAYMNSRKKKSAQDIFRGTYNKIIAFAQGKPLRFEDITKKWIKSFENSMSDLAINSISIHLRNIRRVINEALDDEVTTIPYPFRKYKIRKQKTVKRNLSIEQMRLFRDYPCEKHQEQYRDIFMLMFYLMGINMIDLAHLKEIKNGRVEFYRAKTGRLYSIKVEPEAMEIINRYRGEKYLLHIMNRYTDHKNYLNRLNKNLQRIGPCIIGKHGKKTRESLFPELTTYYTRHSWATYASELDIPKDTIKAALGHGAEETSDTYIDYNIEKIDRANRMVIDTVNVAQISIETEKQ